MVEFNMEPAPADRSVDEVCEHAKFQTIEAAKAFAELYEDAIIFGSEEE